MYIYVQKSLSYNIFSIMNLRVFWSPMPTVGAELSWTAYIEVNSIVYLYRGPAQTGFKELGISNNLS